MQTTNQECWRVCGPMAKSLIIVILTICYVYLLPNVLMIQLRSNKIRLLLMFIVKVRPNLELAYILGVFDKDVMRVVRFHVTRILIFVMSLGIDIVNERA